MSNDFDRLAARKLFGFLVTQYMVVDCLYRESEETALTDNRYSLGKYHGLLESYCVVTGESDHVVHQQVLDAIVARIDNGDL